MRLAIALFLVSALLVAGCGFHAPEAKRTPPPPMPAPPLSSVSVTLAVPAAAIARELNNKTGERIVELDGQSVDCKISRCTLDLIATRTGPAVVHASNGRLSLSLPFVIDARIAAKVAFMKLGARGNGQGLATATTALSLSRDWQVMSHTVGSVTLEHSRVDLGPIRMDLTDILNDNSAKLSQPLFKMLDRRIPSSVRLKPMVARLWSQAFRPISVAKKPRAWLLLAPERIAVGGPETSDDSLDLSLALEGRARVVISDDPPVVAVPALPPLSEILVPQNRFRFYVPALLAYDKAAALAMQALAKKPIRLGNTMTVRFTKLAILPSGSDVVVETRFCIKQDWWDVFDWFDSCGIGYLRGTPRFDAVTNTIRISDVHYDVASESVILSLARVFEEDALGKELEKRLVFAVGRDIAKLQDEVRVALAKPQGRDVTISAEVESFGSPTLTWSNAGFMALFSASGTVQSKLHLQPA